MILCFWYFLILFSHALILLWICCIVHRRILLCLRMGSWHQVPNLTHICGVFRYIIIFMKYYSYCRIVLMNIKMYKIKMLSDWNFFSFEWRNVLVFWILKNYEVCAVQGPHKFIRFSLTFYSGGVSKGTDILVCVYQACSTTFCSICILMLACSLINPFPCAWNISYCGFTYANFCLIWNLYNSVYQLCKWFTHLVFFSQKY